MVSSPARAAPPQSRTHEIDAIRRALESGARVEPHPLLKCGDWVRVKAGPLTGVQGILVRKRNVYRLVLSVEMLGKAAAVEVDAFLVEKINSKELGLGNRSLPELRGPRALALVQ
jgi:transcription antitermination factor NusG